MPSRVVMAGIRSSHMVKHPSDLGRAGLRRLPGRAVDEARNLRDVGAWCNGKPTDDQVMPKADLARIFMAEERAVHAALAVPGMVG